MTIEEWAKDFKSYVNLLDMHRDDYNGIMKYIDDAIALLKEQEAEQPIVHENSYGWKFYYCPKCKLEFYQNRKQAYCDKCGQKVKWDEADRADGENK